MGYTLKIGEAEVSWDEGLVRIDCADVRLDNAPAHGDPTDYTNERWPGYSAWAEAMRRLDMTDVMFNQRNGGTGEFEWGGKHYGPLIQTHPGEAPVTKAHVEYVEEKLAQYKAKHPDHRAQYPPPKEGAVPITGTFYREEDYVDDPRYDAWLCRGEWLAFWLRWAIENCEWPVFINR